MASNYIYLYMKSYLILTVVFILIAKKSFKLGSTAYHRTGQWNSDGNSKEVQKPYFPESLPELDY